ncbi:MAG: SRPBCC family protein [Anaerolineae bacterium]
MKYTNEVMIDLPRERVIELFDNPENLAKWQPGLQSFEHLSGEPGRPGAKSRLVYKEGGRHVEMVETIESRNLPDEFAAIYEAKGVWNVTKSHFEEVGPTKTRWFMENEFRLSGLMAVMAIFMRGSFPKQTQTEMGRFKAFAEGATE